MERPKIGITGDKGTIGSVLRAGLAPDYEVTGFDLPERDLTKKDRELQEMLTGHEAIIHLAWNTAVHNCASGLIDPRDITMFQNVYEVARDTGIPRVIMASSVHADDFQNWQEAELMDPYRLPTPTSPYGASKVMLEAMGRHYAEHYGLEVACVRFGAVRPIDGPPVGEEHVWLSHGDCVGLVKLLIETQSLPNNYAIVYAVSNNAGRIHDLTNPVGWDPQDGVK